MNIIKLYMMQNILYFFVLLRQKYIMNQNRYASRRLYHQCDKVFQPAHFRQLCAITFFGGLRKNFLKKNFKKFFPVTFHAAFQACQRSAAGKNPGRQACGTGACRPGSRPVPDKSVQKRAARRLPFDDQCIPGPGRIWSGPHGGRHPRHAPDHAGNAPAKKP